MRYLLLVVALAAVLATAGHVGAHKPSGTSPVRTADFVPLPPHLS